MARRKSKRSAKKAKLSPEERRLRKIKSDHMRSVRSVFRNLGFERAAEVAGIDVRINRQLGEFDDAFVFENLIVLVEYTTSQSSNITPHLKSKKIIFSDIIADQTATISYLRDKIPVFDTRLGSRYHRDKYIIRLLYCSRYSYDEGIRDIVDEPIYFDYPVLKYFEKLSDIMKMSALNEMFQFLRLQPNEIAKGGAFPVRSRLQGFEGSILPESSSGFPDGYKVVSFYADAEALLRRAFVLRRDGWRGSFQAYQRMVLKPKIEAIRKRLKMSGQVLVNNLIATLPADVRTDNPDGSPVNVSRITATQPVTIHLPERSNSIGLIDGQHRLYAYYESKEDDPQIAKLRRDQNLLVTGIVYPSRVSDSERERFEAALFLSINANQTNASTPLRQEIEVFLHPSSPTAIGRQVIQRLAKSGPLSEHIEKYFFEKGKLKTSSIVSYGLGPLIKLSGEDSLFKLFDHADKGSIETGATDEVLEAYLQFCASTINTFLNAVKSNVDSARWTADSAEKNRLLTVTYVNSFLITLRKLVENNKPLNFEKLKAALEGIQDFDFRSYHSSQYGRMAEQIYQNYFSGH